MSNPIVVQIVLDKPLAQGFDYLWDEKKLGSLPKLGNVVEIPFSRSRAIGIVIKVSAHTNYDFNKLKDVEKVAPLPPLDPALLRLMRSISLQQPMEMSNT